MRSVEAQAGGPDEVLAAEADRCSLGDSFVPFVFAVLRGGGGFRLGGGTLVRAWRLRDEPFQVDRGAAEQELHVEGGGAAAADAAESVLVLQFGDHALGVGHPAPVRPDAGGAFRATDVDLESLIARARAASASRCALVRGS